MKTKIILLLLVVFLLGCDNKKSYSPKEDDKYHQNPNPANPPPD